MSISRGIGAQIPAAGVGEKVINTPPQADLPWPHIDLKWNGTWSRRFVDNRSEVNDWRELYLQISAEGNDPLLGVRLYDNFHNFDVYVLDFNMLSVKLETYLSMFLFNKTFSSSL